MGTLTSAFRATLSRIAEIEKNIQAEQAELTALRLEVDELRKIVSRAGGASVIPAQRTRAAIRSPRRRPIHESSSVGWARRVLQTAKRPMHVDEMVKMIGHMSGLPVSKATLVSNLSRYHKAGDTFRRTASNTFELIPDEEKSEIQLVG